MKIFGLLSKGFRDKQWNLKFAIHYAKGYITQWFLFRGVTITWTILAKRLFWNKGCGLGSMAIL